MVGLAGCSIFGSEENQNSSASGQSLRDSDSPGLPAPVLGNPESDVRVSAFTNFKCGYCARYMLQVFPKLYKEYIKSGDIGYETFDIPTPLDAEAWRAANAAHAVQDTVGVGPYYDFSHALFVRYYENQSLSLSDYEELAPKFGADAETVRNAAKEGRYDTTIEADRQLSNELDVTGTPMIFVNGKMLEKYSFEAIKSAIEDAR